MNLQRHYESANRFLSELAYELGDEKDIDRATRVLRSVLSALRDRLTFEESFDLLATFPLFIKGIYVDGWRPGKETPKVKSLSHFIELVRENDGRAVERDFPNEEQSLHAVMKTFHVLKRNSSLGEALDVGAELPPEIRDFWLTA